MAFRHYGGLNYAKKNNIVSNAYSASDSITINQNLLTETITTIKDMSCNSLNIGCGGSNISTNTIVGSSNLKYNIQGCFNTAIGYNSLLTNTLGYQNTAIGSNSLYSNTGGYQNTSNGAGSLYSNTVGYQNTAHGAGALFTNTTGQLNTACGSGSLYSNTYGYQNTAQGTNSLYSNTGGYQNIAFGVCSLLYNTNGYQNTGIGCQSLFSLNNGCQNTAIGFQSASNLVSGINNTCIGNQALPSNSTVSNEFTLGNSEISTLRCYASSLTSLSDERDKKNIEPLKSCKEFINMLNPVDFVWDTRDGSKKDVEDVGFIAQELQNVQKVTGINIPGLVYDINPEKLEASYGKLIPVLVKAIQEQNAKIQELEEKIDSLCLCNTK